MNAYNLKNPTVPTIPTTVDLDEALKGLQTRLAGLTWLSKSFARARNMKSQLEGGANITEPKVYQGGSEYYPVLPNDALTAFSFMRTWGERRISEESQWQKSGMVEVTLDIIFWANLREVDRTKDYIFTDELINESYHLINSYPGVKVTRIFDEDFKDIYRGYDLVKTHTEKLIYPYASWRFETEFTHIISC